MAEGGDAFDCRVPQIYESLSLALIDQITEADGADEFFDVAATPPKEEGAQTEEFFTPLPMPNAAVNARTLLSPVVEEPDGIEGTGVDSSDRRKSSSDLPQGRIILKAKRRSWQLPKKADNDKKEVEKLASQMFEGIRLEPPTPEKTHPMMTRQDVAVKTPTLSLRNRQVIRNSMKRMRIQSPSTKQPPVKFIALAEQVQHFFNDTPPRFRRSPRKIGPEENRDKERVKLTLTVPHSPHLRTKDRARTPSPVREESHQIKALPLNPKVFHPPDSSCKPQPKPATVPEPFNLTVVPKKEDKISAESIELIQFKARPMPRSCRSSLSSLCSNTSTTASVRRVAVHEKGDGTLEVKEDSSHCGVSHLGTSNRRQLKVQPFSFDMRDRIALQKKEQKIRMLMEEAAKIPKFTARPAPSFITHQSAADESSSSSTVGSTSRKSLFHNHSAAIPTQKQALP
uniref:Targeting protein for Xklp2 n=1 Tax=Lygus hesperus TaxID=30085 RepID=A0A0K8SVS7_LYGHE